MYITGHGQCDCSMHIISLELNPNVYCCVHVDGYEMVSILCRAILEIEIVVQQAEKCFPAVMHPESACVLHWMIPEWSHMIYQFLICNDASLFEDIRTLLNAHVNPPIVVHQCFEVISVDDLLWDDFKMIKYAHNTYDGRTRKDTVGRYIV